MRSWRFDVFRMYFRLYVCLSATKQHFWHIIGIHTSALHHGISDSPQLRIWLCLAKLCLKNCMSCECVETSQMSQMSHMYNIVSQFPKQNKTVATLHMNAQGSCRAEVKNFPIQNQPVWQSQSMRSWVAQFHPLVHEDHRYLLPPEWRETSSQLRVASRKAPDKQMEINNQIQIRRKTMTLRKRDVILDLGPKLCKCHHHQLQCALELPHRLPKELKIA